MQHARRKKKSRLGGGITYNPPEPWEVPSASAGRGEVTLHILKQVVAAVVALGLSLGVDLQAQITFVDRAPLTNTDDRSFGRGAAMIDVDGDGLLDLIAANDNMPNFFFRQQPDHTFEDATAAWGIAFDDRQHWGVLVTDFDNDGDPDVYFINGGFPGQPNQLLRNDISTSPMAGSTALHRTQCSSCRESRTSVFPT